MVSISKPGGVRRLKKYGSVSARFSSSSYRSRMSWKVVGAWFSESLKIESSLLCQNWPKGCEDEFLPSQPRFFHRQFSSCESMISSTYLSTNASSGHG